MGNRDMKSLNCQECGRRFFNSVVYLEHMRLEHPGKEPQNIIFIRFSIVHCRHKQNKKTTCNRCKEKFCDMCIDEHVVYEMKKEMTS